MKRIIRYLLVFGALVLWTLPGPAAAQTERITDYFSHIEVAADGVLTVSEVVTVQATGDQIERGIYRDFPTTYRRPGGGAHRVGFEIVEVKRDGNPIAYFTENKSNGVRVYMGSKNIRIDPGIYTYTLTYKTDRQIGFFEAHDELYWNVTGNDWLYPIELTSVFVQLPAGATVVGLTGYTGRRGEKGADFVPGGDGDGRATFQTTRTLAPGEGFTIVVTWPKGHVSPPGAAEKGRYFLRDNLVYFAAAGGFGGVLIFYLLAWLYFGRDPARGTIIPRWKPPRGISPAAARYVTRMKFDDKALGAAVVSLAVKGHLTIEDAGRKKYELKKRTAPAQRMMSQGERAFTRALFRWTDTALVKKGNHLSLKPAVDALEATLSTDFENAHFVHNIGVVVVGVVLSALAALGAGMAIPGFSNALETVVPMAIAMAIIGIVFFRAVRATSIVERLIAVAIAVILMVNFPGEMRVVFAMSFALIGLNAGFVHLMKAPTMTGRRLLDKIEGFRMYLATAEQERLNMLHPPERTPELFEKYLPYAMALDVETEWGDQFKDVLAAAAAGREGGYQPGWYHGRHGDWMSSPGKMAGGIGSSLGGAIASSATPPGSSSGMGGGGGGGSSGGGGGGGGGGGF